MEESSQVEKFTRVWGWLLAGLGGLGVVLCFYGMYGLAARKDDSSSWIVAGATLVYASLTYRIVQETRRAVRANEDATSANWQVVEEMRAERELAHSPWVAASYELALQFEGGWLQCWLRNVGGTVAERVGCNAWQIVGGPSVHDHQPSPSKRWYSLPCLIGAGETAPVLLQPVQEGALGPIEYDLAHAREVLRSFEERWGFRPSPGTLLCEVGWEDRDGNRRTRPIQLYIAPYSLPPEAQTGREPPAEWRAGS